MPGWASPVIGGGSQTQRHFIEAGRRVSALNLVCFAFAVDDVLQGVIVPLALLSQVSDVWALALWREASASVAHLG